MIHLLLYANLPSWLNVLSVYLCMEVDVAFLQDTLHGVPPKKKKLCVSDLDGFVELNVLCLGDEITTQFVYITVSVVCGCISVMISISQKILLNEPSPLFAGKVSSDLLLFELPATQWHCMTELRCH